MKFFRLALVAIPVFAGLSGLRAQEEGQTGQDEIITDFGIDDYIYVPKYTLHIGARELSGMKATFTGRGTVQSIIPPDDYKTANIPRFYQDGAVFPDSRQVADSDGISTPVSNDGYTNFWSYKYDGQVSPDGYMTFHGYSANIADPGVKDKEGEAAFGVEVVVDHDMGKIGKKQKLEWKISAGLSLNDIYSKRRDALNAQITTITDYYSLNGQTPPPAPYSGPTTVSGSVLNPDGTITTVSVDGTTLLSNKPIGRDTTITDGIVMNTYKVKGAFFTLRAGPTVTYSITDHFKASFSAGAALVFAGSTYSVDQVYTPLVGDDVVNLVDDTTEKLLPGYYADLSLEYDFTERAGAYAGAVYQDTGSYTQSIRTTNAFYETRVDLASMQGFRMGMNFRF